MQDYLNSYTTQIHSSDNYHDANALNDLKRKARVSSEEALPEVAKQFESLFIHMMMKSMREASFGDPLFGSSDGDSYRDMYDQQLSVTLSKDSGIGIAEAVMRQLSAAPQPGSSRFTLERDPESAADSSTQVDSKQTDSAQAPSAVIGATNSAVQTHLLSNSSPGSLNTPNEHLIAMVGAMPATGAKISMPEQVRSRQFSLENDFKKPISGNSGLTDSINQLPELPKSFASAKEFIHKLMPHAKEAEQKSGIPAEVMIAQAALETGWGKKIIGSGEKHSHNLFNIKADQRWGGDSIEKNTLEYMKGKPLQVNAAFRAYNSYPESFSDYTQFLQNSSRYEQALKHTEDPERYLHELQKAGYATDPDYAKKIWRIMNGDVMQAAISEKVATTNRA